MTTLKFKFEAVLFKGLCVFAVFSTRNLKLLHLSLKPEMTSKMVVIVLKGTNGRQKTYEVSPVYIFFYSGFMCQTTIIFGITKDGSLY